MTDGTVGSRRASRPFDPLVRTVLESGGRFDGTGKSADLAGLTSAIEALLAAIPGGDAESAAGLISLGYQWRMRFEATGERNYLAAAITASQAAVDATPAGHPLVASHSSYLGEALMDLFLEYGLPADLSRAIENLKRAVEEAPAGQRDRARYLSYYSGALLLRFEQAGDLADLDAAVQASQVAVDTLPAGDHERAGLLVNLANALAHRYMRAEARADLDTAIAYYTDAVAATPASDPEYPHNLSNLGTALRLRFERTGATEDIDAAAEALKAAIDATPPGHTDQKILLNNLAELLLARFARGGSTGDVDAVIDIFRDGSAALPAGHAGLPIYQSNLGSALLERFRRTGQPGDISEAISALSAAIAAIPAANTYLRTIAVSNLGSAFGRRFSRTGSPTDQDAAVDCYRTALDTAPDGTPLRALQLGNLGNALRTRFGQSADPADLDAAVSSLRAAVEESVDNPERAFYLTGLGLALHARTGLQDHDGSAADHTEALAALVRAARMGLAAPSVRIHAARTAASVAAGSEPSLAVDMIELAIRLLPQTTPRQLTRSDQQYMLTGFPGLASDAAALVLAEADATGNTARQPTPARALELLEAGRTVLLSQAIDVRSDVANLRDRHPVLAARFEELRDRLDQPDDSASQVSQLMDEASTASAYARSTGLRRQLAGEFTELLAQIRDLPDLATFGLPPVTGDLLAEARHGPVVAFSISSYRSDALLLAEDTVTALSLPGLAHDALTARGEAFYRTLAVLADPDATIKDLRAAGNRLSGTLEWLWDVAAEPVLTALGYDRPPAPGQDWPRVWWAPGGLLGALPLHAAGYHTATSGATTMDCVISSYTPTVRALRYAREHAATAAERSLIVAMPTTPGLPGAVLPGVPAEVNGIRGLLPDPLLLARPGAGLPSAVGFPTKASVLERLPGCAIAHFACHGASDSVDPSRSLLLLDDHDRDPFNVASLAAVNLADAQVAYLSACRTALNQVTVLLDEAIHLASAFQIAGFPRVIGTLWEVRDNISAEVALDFYQGLYGNDGILDVRLAARALHRAVRKQRDRHPAAPSAWAAYLHTGS